MNSSISLAAMDATSINTLPVPDTGMVLAESGVDDAYIDYYWVRAFIDQHTISTLLQSAKNIMEGRFDTVTQTQSTLAGSEMYDETPSVLHCFLARDHPDEKFEPEPQLNNKYIQAFFEHLWRKASRDPDNRHILEAAACEFKLIRVLCRGLVHQTAKMLDKYNAFLDHATFCRDQTMEEGARAGISTQAVPNLNLSAALQERQKLYEQFKKDAERIEIKKPFIVSWKRHFLLATLVILYNMEACFKGEREKFLALQPGNTRDTWLQEMNKADEQLKALAGGNTKPQAK